MASQELNRSASAIGTGSQRKNSTTAIRAAGHISITSDRFHAAAAAPKPKTPSPRSQLLAQKPHGFAADSPRSQSLNQRVANIVEDSAMQEMAQYLRRGGSSSSLLPGLGSLLPQGELEEQKTPTSSRKLPARHGSMASLADSSVSPTASIRHFLSEPMPTPSVARRGTRIAEWAGDVSKRHSAPSKGGTLASLPAFRTSKFGSTLQSTLQESTAWTDQEPSGTAEQAPRPSTREMIQQLRTEGRGTADMRTKHLASLPMPNEDMYRKPRAHQLAPSAASDASPPTLRRQPQSMPNLRGARHETEASQEYREEVDRLLRRLMTDVDLSHSEMPARHAKLQVCSHLDKAQQFLNRSESVGRSLEESAGSPKLPRQQLGLPEAGLRLPAGSPVLPGSVKWEKPEPKPKPRKKQDSPRTLRLNALKEMHRMQNLDHLAS